MGILKKPRRRVTLLAMSAALVVIGGLGLAKAATTAPPINALAAGRGVNEFAVGVPGTGVPVLPDAMWAVIAASS